MPANGPHVGEQAPDFTLPSTGGGHFTLSDLRGHSNVVLAFFPGAFTATCTDELCDFTLGVPEFEAVDTTVVGVSVDSIPALRVYRELHDIRIDLLSDFKRDVSRTYGTLIEELFFSDRAYFIVDRSGILRWKYFEQDLDDRRKKEELLAVLRTLA